MKEIDEVSSLRFVLRNFKKYLLFISFSMLLSSFSFAQKSIEIAKFENGNPTLNNNLDSSCIKAFERTFRDGTKVIGLKVEKIGNNYFLLADCNYKNYKRKAAINIEQQGDLLILKEDALMKICSAVACQTCNFFIENNKIIACKCEQTGTISNHCHYKSTLTNIFFQNLQRAIKMMGNK